MLTNYEKLASYLESAQQSCRKAEESMAPLASVKQVDAYLFGMLQAVKLILADARKAAMTANKAKKSPIRKPNSNLPT